MEASVIIPTMNRAETLRKCLISLLQLDFSPKDFEVIVVDNASKDHTHAVVEEFQKLGNEYTIKYFYEPVEGLLSGRHRGAKESSSEILCYVDDDVLFDPSWLRAIVESFSSPLVDIVGGPSLGEWESPVPQWVKDNWRHEKNKSYLGDLSLIEFGDKVQIIPAEFVWGLNYSIRKKTLFELGGFHPDCIPASKQEFQGDGETGLSYKISKKGTLAVYHPSAKVYHMTPKGRLTPAYLFKRYYYQGVCDSYTKIRIAKNPELVPLPQEKKFNLNQGSPFQQYQALLKQRAWGDYRKGFEFHLNKVLSDKSLLRWVLQASYLEEWDYTLNR